MYSLLILNLDAYCYFCVSVCVCVCLCIYIYLNREHMKWLKLTNPRQDKNQKMGTRRTHANFHSLVVEKGIDWL